MIKYETINGTLCRMVEPKPLQPDSPMPCVVRLIQDDSPMGKYNQSYLEYRYGVALGCCMLPIIATHIAKSGIVNDVEWDVNRYEIIGYPVVEGSKEWALYQMQNGNAVRNTASGYKFVLRNEYVCHVCEEKTGFTYSVDEWLSGAAKSGWQLYTEPKPENSVDRIMRLRFHNVKIGDIAVCDNSASSRITQVNEKDELFATGDHTWANEITWYSMKDGASTETNISPVIAIVKPEHNGWKPPLQEYEKYCDKCSGYGIMQEPEPKPAKEQFEVGDWVEHKESKEQATIRHIMNYGAIEIEFAYSTESDIYQTNDFHNDFRKLDPSEVVVNIGCLSGTVTYAISDDCFLLAKVNDPQHRACCIDMSMLDTTTRSLVESLLNAQEEK